MLRLIQVCFVLLANYYSSMKTARKVINSMEHCEKYESQKEREPQGGNFSRCLAEAQTRTQNASVSTDTSGSGDGHNKQATEEEKDRLRPEKAEFIRQHPFSKQSYDHVIRTCDDFREDNYDAYKRAKNRLKSFMEKEDQVAIYDELRSMAKDKNTDNIGWQMAGTFLYAWRREHSIPHRRDWND